MPNMPVSLPEKSASLFFIGIGGVSMSALALIAQDRGYRVGGSDRSASAVTERLIAAGIDVHIGHDEKNVDGYDVLIYNAAIHPDNPEFSCGVRRGLRRIYRTDFLAALMGDYPNAVGIAGTHGKSTASAMLSHMFLRAGRDPSVLIGAALGEIGGSHRVGHGDDFVFEACEYRDSFLSLRPTVSVVLNVEMDHPDYFHSIEQVRDSFARFLSIPGKNGYGVINLDSPDAVLAAERADTRIVTYSTRKEADYTAADVTLKNGFPSFLILRRGVPLTHVTLRVAGQHNVENALACAAAADLCGMDASAIGDGLSSFPGIARRMEQKGVFPGTEVPVFDDFGHHPTEVRRTLEGAAAMGFSRIFCVYQPHTYSRTAELFDDFTASFGAAWETLFVDIYAARETDTRGVSSERLAAATPRARYCADYDAVTSYLSSALREGDAVVIMGAGDISRYAETLCRKDLHHERPE